MQPTRDARSIGRAVLSVVVTWGLIALPGCTGQAEGEMPPDVMLCEARLRLEGTFTLEKAQPEDIFGCWPVGLWVVRPTNIESSTCPQDPKREPSYSFRVTQDETNAQRVQFVSNPGYERLKAKVTSGGSGLCQGGFKIFSPSGTETLHFKASLHEDKHVDGFAEYTLYSSDQWIRPDN